MSRLCRKVKDHWSKEKLVNQTIVEEGEEEEESTALALLQAKLAIFHLAEWWELVSAHWEVQA